MFEVSTKRQGEESYGYAKKPNNKPGARGGRKVFYVRKP